MTTEQVDITLRWEDNCLYISGNHVPGTPLVMQYLEAICRPGSTNRPWDKTVVPHTTRCGGVGANDVPTLLQRYEKDFPEHLPQT